MKRPKPKQLRLHPYTSKRWLLTHYKGVVVFLSACEALTFASSMGLGTFHLESVERTSRTRTQVH